MIGRIRIVTQHLMFIFLIYGGRAGIKLGHSLPCFACPYVSGCSGHCYLMALQGKWGFEFAVADLFSYEGFRVLLYFAIFIFLIILLSKFWCGWICPFGTFQDWLAILRKKTGIRESEFSWKTRDGLKKVKYVLLAFLIIIPVLITYAGLHSDFSLPFCQICPAKPIMPLFTGNVDHFALDYTNVITGTFSALSIIIAAAIIVGSFFKDRFFCLFCPMLPLIQLFKKISLLRFEKEADLCSGCGNCHRMCPVDIRKVSDERSNKAVMDEDCILCMKCQESCPEDNVLSLKFLKYRIFLTSRKYFIRNNRS
ncbi:MAG: 4Fe-4S binding protein [Spirochaetes bacterium]|nr:4Fe-4S binding protein [Spirochaetota bacterium]